MSEQSTEFPLQDVYDHSKSSDSEIRINFVAYICIVDLYRFFISVCIMSDKGEG